MGRGYKIRSIIVSLVLGIAFLIYSSDWKGGLYIASFVWLWHMVRMVRD